MSEPSLTWSQPRAFRRWYELRGAHGLVGELRFPGLFTAKARATVGQSLWDIRSEGLHHSQVQMVRAGSNDAEVTFTRHWLWSGGTLDFRGRPPLRMRIALLRRKLLLQTPAGERILSLSYRGVLHSRGELHFGPRATTYEPNVLAVIAWYLAITGLFQSGSEWAFS